MKGFVPANLIGIYVNADDIEHDVKATGFLDLSIYKIHTTPQILHSFIDQHSLLVRFNRQVQAKLIGLDGDRIDFTRVPMDSYFASAIADFIRHQLLELGENFTFETVMSSPDKVEFLELAQRKGYRTYLYYVSTDSVDINIQRVANRVAEGGHNVPEDKIRKRYKGSLDLLPAAVEATHRAYIFDNSEAEAVLLAEVTDGTDFEFRFENLPDWFVENYVDKVLGAAED
ncbi:MULTISPECIES: zeta toxin family protein [unclassified Pseudomonas]|jgi:predicted ABC-type ATPase|uniref:zeta toxin family protein n=1 Tax=unclassified Pseudomonas TaxID=196821 RepID=UPI00177B68C6|nr:MULTISPECIES: zeta toxin family protein [unclassified Pseudomonas]MBD8705248.1 zeta toxin family protein [Pseudomonas sp. CFBP 13711]MBD8711638.1 zeta toxin family protein [Pseudomonas sp. CFBP 13715]